MVLPLLLLLRHGPDHVLPDGRPAQIRQEGQRRLPDYDEGQDSGPGMTSRGKFFTVTILFMNL